MLRVLELFSGIGAASKALENLGIEHEIVDAVEIDKYAIKAFNAIHGTSFEPQDITKWDKDIDVDLIMHGSPCQDFSVAGRQAGGDKGSGTRSSLMYETLRIVDKLRPKYVIWENVKNLLSKKHRHNFDAYLETMEKFGYKNHYQVLDAQNYGVPQHRERVFTVSILGGGDFKFPEPIPLEKKLKDVLEKKVDEKYYLDSKYEKYYLDSKYENLVKVNENYGMMEGGVIGKMHDSSRRAYSPEYVSPTLPTCAGGNIQPKVIEGPTPLQREVCDKAIERGLVTTNDAVEYTYSNARLKEIEEGYIKKQNRANNQIMSTLKTNPQQIGVCVDNEITPREKVWYNGLYEERYKESRKVLPILWEKIGEETFSEWAIRGLWCILSESVLWKNVHAKGVFENWLKRPELVKCSFLGSKYKPDSIKENYVRNMWVDWQDRYPSYRQQLSEQQFRQLKSIVQKLPHEDASFKGFVQGLWETYEGSGVLRKALSEIQEIWQPNAHWEVQRSSYRIRKLTPLSCYRLMGFDDESFDKASKVISSTQLYKTAGNSIVVDVLMAIFRELLKDGSQSR